MVDRQVKLLLLQGLNLLDEVGQRVVLTLVGGRLISELKNESRQVLKLGRSLADNSLVRILAMRQINYQQLFSHNSLLHSYSISDQNELKINCTSNNISY